MWWAYVFLGGVEKVRCAHSLGERRGGGLRVCPLIWDDADSGGEPHHSDGCLGTYPDESLR